MADFELKITGSFPELFQLAARLGGSTAAPAVIASQPIRLTADPMPAAATVTVPEGPHAPDAVVELSVSETAQAETAKRKRRTKAEIAADEAVAKGSVFDGGPAEDIAAPAEEPAVQVEQPETPASPQSETTATQPSQPTSDASPADTADQGDKTWNDCETLMKAVVNQAGGAPVAQLMEAMKATGFSNLVALKEGGTADFAAVYAALLPFKK